MNLSVSDHPLTQHYLSVLRDERTRPEEFRAATRRLTYMLLAKATERIPLREIPITTPLEPTTGHRVGDLVAVAVLRAGLGMLEAVIDLLPHAVELLRGRVGDHVAPSRSTG